MKDDVFIMVDNKPYVFSSNAVPKELKITDFIIEKLKSEEL